MSVGEGLHSKALIANSAKNSVKKKNVSDVGCGCTQESVAGTQYIRVG